MRWGLGFNKVTDWRNLQENACAGVSFFIKLQAEKSFKTHKKTLPRECGLEKG